MITAKIGSGIIIIGNTDSMYMYYGIIFLISETDRM